MIYDYDGSIATFSLEIILELDMLRNAKRIFQPIQECPIIECSAISSIKIYCCLSFAK
jgi:hypothetical protein